MNRTTVLKFFTSLFLVIISTIVPWWVVLGLMLFSFFIFSSFYWGIGVGLFLDLFYGPAPSLFFPFPFLLISIALILFVPFLKYRLVFWNS